ncbi:hypothetical protein [Erythrobacter ani]|uniref:Uncharacterized protein n=1 Tax=Erythrobacter ani TaxID=2827235 RepID=A0ABS6SL80_9SPHN|nr:hypothetical protein [Erythrobacter ani]MBV7265819.1 hypothetical protein [Erythrobacter ani]
MFANLFKNPKAALAYVGITLFSVMLFVGTEDKPGSLKQTVDSVSSEGPEETAEGRQFGDEVATSGDILGKARPRSESDGEIEFATDEELIDAAKGFNPAPSYDFSGYNPNPKQQDFLSDQDKIVAQDDDGGWAVSPAGE